VDRGTLHKAGQADERKYLTFSSFCPTLDSRIRRAALRYRQGDVMEAPFTPAQCAVPEVGCRGSADLRVIAAFGIHACLPCAIVLFERRLSALYTLRNEPGLTDRQQRCRTCGQHCIATSISPSGHCPSCEERARIWAAGHTTTVDALLRD